MRPSAISALHHTPDNDESLEVGHNQTPNNDVSLRVGHHQTPDNHGLSRDQLIMQ